MSNSFVTPWTVACQAPLSVQFLRHEYWSGLPFPSPGDLPDPGMEPKSPALAGGFFTTEPPGKPMYSYNQANLSKKGHLSERKREVIQKAYAFSHQEKISSKVTDSWC